MDTQYRKLSDAKGKYLLDDYVYETRRLVSDDIIDRLERRRLTDYEPAYFADISTYRFVRSFADKIRSNFNSYTEVYREYEELRNSSVSEVSPRYLAFLEQQAKEYSSAFNEAMDGLTNPLNNVIKNAVAYEWPTGSIDGYDRSLELIALGDDDTYHEWLRDLASITVGRGGPSQIYWYLEEFGSRLSVKELAAVDSMCREDVDYRYPVWNGKRKSSDSFILEEIRMYHNDWCELSRSKYVPSVIKPETCAYCREVPNAVLHDWIKPTPTEAAAVEPRYSNRVLLPIERMPADLVDVKRVQSYNQKQAAKGLVNAAPYVKSFLEIKKASPDMLIFNPEGTAGLDMLRSGDRGMDL